MLWYCLHVCVCHQTQKPIANMRRWHCKKKKKGGGGICVCMLQCNVNAWWLLVGNELPRHTCSKANSLPTYHKANLLWRQGVRGSCWWNPVNLARLCPQLEENGLSQTIGKLENITLAAAPGKVSVFLQWIDIVSALEQRIHNEETTGEIMHIQVIS